MSFRSDTHGEITPLDTSAGTPAAATPARWLIPVVLAFAGCLALAPAGCSSAAESAGSAPSASFVPLFNGRDLTGWEQVLDSEWVVEDGVLVSRQDPAGRREGESWLLTARDYEDFVLRIEYRLTPGGNSGIFLRDPVARAERRAAPDGGTPPWDAGYEVNLNSTEPNYPTGSVWAAVKGAPGLETAGEWNTLEVKIEGDRIWTSVNGQTAIDGAELPPRARRGAIGLQRHGGEAYRDKVIEVRSIEIREL